RAGCRRCDRLVEMMAREMPHLSLWTLMKQRLGGLNEAERRSIDYHLEEGECSRCRARAGLLGAGAASAARFPGLLLPAPHAVGAASGTLEMNARSPDGRLEAELLEEERQLVLEVRTREAELQHQLVGYALVGENRQVDGFLVLRADVE